MEKNWIAKTDVIMDDIVLGKFELMGIMGTNKKGVKVFYRGGSGRVIHTYSCDICPNEQGNTELNGLTEMFLREGLHQGDKVEILYSAALGALIITNEPVGIIDWGDVTKIVFRPMLANDEDDSDELEIDSEIDFGLDFALFAFPTCDVEESCLGIPDSESWQNLPYHGVMLRYNCSWRSLSALSNEEYVVFHYENGPEFYVFNRTRLTCHRITATNKGKRLDEYFRVCGKMEFLNDTLYFCGDDNILYKTDLRTGATEVVLNWKGKKAWERNLWVSYDEGNHATLYCSSNGSLYNVETREKFGPFPEGIEIKLIEGSVVLLSDFSVYNLDTKTKVSGKDYIRNYFLNSDEKCRILWNEIESGHHFLREFVQAVDLYTDTITVAVIPIIKSKVYPENTLLKLKMFHSPEVLSSVYSNPEKWATPPHGGLHRACFRDCEGHVNAILSQVYDMVYKDPDGSVRKLFYTLGSGVPECYQQTDNHTVVVKTNEREVTIVDFAKNAKYTIKI